MPWNLNHVARQESGENDVIGGHNPSVADLGPAPLGPKVMLIRQLFPTASEEPQASARRKDPALGPVSSRLKSVSAAVPVLLSLMLCV